MEKQESVSRQSSILKPPKQRQPLQCVATNPSSSENSPTIKIKRRVSFAKNKRIREFCNEAEQGTVWDNTYEEHDLSNPKNSSNDNDSPVIIKVPCDDKENFPVQLFMKSNELTCKEVPQSISTEGENLSQSDMEMDNSINNFASTSTADQNYENQYENETIYCDDGMDMTTYVPSEIIPCRRIDDCISNNIPTTSTITQNISTEISQNIPLATYRQFMQHQTVDKNFLASNSTDLTEAISSILSVGCTNKLTKLVGSENQNFNTESYKNTIDYSSTTQMEFTSVLPSSTWIKPDHQCQNEDVTGNITKTVDLPYINHKNKNMDNSIASTEKTNIFANKSMDMTEPILTKIKNIYQQIKKSEKLKVVKNNPTEITETLPILISKQIDVNAQTLINRTQEKTNIFVNNSMNVTEAVPNIHTKMCEVYNNTLPLNNLTEQEKIKAFQNNSMPIMEANHVFKKKDHLDNNMPLSNFTTQEKIKLFKTNSIEKTKAIPTISGIHQIDNNTELSKNITLDKTKFFSTSQNESTKTVSHYNKIHQIDTNIQTNNVTDQDKTKFVLNNSMDIIQAIPIYKEIRVDNKTQLSVMQEKTKIFLNSSMEMTEVVPTLHKTLDLCNNVEPSNNIISKDKTRIFVNNSMEMTEAVPTYNKKESVHNAELSSSIIPEKTKVFLNNSMEMTEVIPTLHKIKQFNADTEPLSSITTEEKTKVFMNNSMELTEAVPTYNKRHGVHNAEATSSIIPEKTKIFLNNSMEMTEAIPTLNKIKQFNANTEPLSSITAEEKTKVFMNNSMELTEAVPTYNKRHGVPNAEPISSLIPEKTKIFLNNSMEMTEAVPTSDKMKKICTNLEHFNSISTQEKTNIFFNHSMEITEAVPTYNKMHRLHKAEPICSIIPEKSKIFLNNSMEMTEVIPTSHKIKELSADAEPLPSITAEEKTKVFLNNSMDLTEAVPKCNEIHQVDVAQPLSTRIEEKTQMFMNNSMKLTEAVPKCNEILKVDISQPLSTRIEEKTQMFMNNSMELTEAVPKCNEIHQVDVAQPLSTRIEEKTQMFMNNSMEMTGVFPMYDRINFLGMNQQSQNNVAQGKTEVYLNNSMVMSELNPTCEKNCKFVLEADKTTNDRMETKTKLFFDKFKDDTNNIQRKSNKRQNPFESESAQESKKLSPNISRDNDINKIDIVFDQPKYTSILTAEPQQEKAKVFSNKSIDVSETIPIQGILNDNFRRDPQEKTKIFHDRSMEMTKAISGYWKDCKSNQLLNENLNENKTECFFNKSMDITENIPVKQISFQNLETKMSLDKPNNTHEIPVANRIECSSNKLTDATVISPCQQQVSTLTLANQKKVHELNQEKTQIFLDKSMDISETMVVNKMNSKSISQYKNVTCSDNQIDHNVSSDFTSKLSMLPTKKKMILEHSRNKDLINDATKVVLDVAAMEFRELPPALSSTAKNSKILNHSNFSTISNKTNTIQNSISNNMYNKSNYEMSDRFSTKEETFHRITSDELNILCASMNLPTQKYSNDEKITPQNNFIPSCTDVNVLRDSLKKNSMFDVAEPVAPNTTYREEDKDLHRRISKNYQDYDSENVTKIVCSTDMNDLSFMGIPIRSESNKPRMDTAYRNTVNTAKIRYNCSEQEKTEQVFWNLDQQTSQSNIFIDKSLQNPMNEVVAIQNTVDISNKSIKNINTEAKSPINLGNKLGVQTSLQSLEQESSLQIYHDNNVELQSSRLISSIEIESDKLDQPLNGQTRENYDKSENSNLSRENSLTRLPSNNTDLLIATMGFKTKIPHPLIINDKTTITISNKSLTNKTDTFEIHEKSCIEPKKTYTLDKNVINESQYKQHKLSNLINNDIQNESKYSEILLIENNKKMDDLEKCVGFDKNTKKNSLEVHLTPEKFSEKLDEIQPPSFLDSDNDLSGQEECLQNKNYFDSILNNSNEQCVLPKYDNVFSREIRDSASLSETINNSTRSEVEKLKRSNYDLDCLSIESNKSNEILGIGKSKIDLVEEAITPFLSLTENLKTHEKRDDCIWSIRTVKPNVIAIDFITKSFVVIVRLNELNEDFFQDIKKIEFVSRIRSDSKNIFFKIVHRLLLLKLKPDEMLNKYKIYEDVLPLLQCVSKEVIFSMNFVSDLKKLSAMNLMEIDTERIKFMISSRKSNIILKASLELKVFNEIGPNDIDVICVLGDVRKSDIKKLIVNIKRDYTFLSRYINDVKEYITLMEN